VIDHIYILYNAYINTSTQQACRIYINLYVYFHRKTPFWTSN